jgi:hypothetical protein
VTLAAEQQLEVDRLRALVASTSDVSAEQLLAQRAVPFRRDLGYDPLASVNLDLLQGSALALDDAELAALAANGFVVTDRLRYPHFAYGYQTIYSQDLPVFVSADAILQAVHQSYDAILATIEVAALVPELETLLASMRARLASAPALDAETRADADLFLAVGMSLLQGSIADPSPAPARRSWRSSSRSRRAVRAAPTSRSSAPSGSWTSRSSCRAATTRTCPRCRGTSAR